jgi:predicted nucleotide-binding protein (sugar kinase/HSP70/actin superfamily)
MSFPFKEIAKLFLWAISCNRDGMPAITPTITSDSGAFAQARCEGDCGFSNSNLHSFERPTELPFRAEERETVTILFGGLTWKHERLIEGLLAGAGYKCKALPETDRSAHELGKEFCASGLCNPVYFTVGNLIRYLRKLENSGLSRPDIVRQYIYFTAACGGPCRFGMYEAEFRTALHAAGYIGFRVLSFSQDHGIKASTGHTGLQFSVDFGMNALHSFILGDLLNVVQRRLRPYEMQSGSTKRAITRATDNIAAHFRTFRGFDWQEHIPSRVLPDRESQLYRVPNTLGKVWSHLYGDALTQVLPSASKELQSVEVDWLRVKPVVKVIGEFWAQMTESDGNFQMLDFLETEGAEVSIEPISTWVLYLLHQKAQRAAHRKRMNLHAAKWTDPKIAFMNWLSSSGQQLEYALGSRIYIHHFRRLAQLLGVPELRPAPQEDLANLARPYYDTMLRGGEGHLEVGKTLYFAQRKSCHLVLALKPFGCLPSLQSDGVQASLVERFPDVNFLPIETSGDGEIHAYSRVQMALSEARIKATAEFELAVETARHSLDEIRSFVAATPELRHPLEPIPRHAGMTSTAANFLLYADRLMSGTLSDHVSTYQSTRDKWRSNASGQIRSTGD